ncbi:MAG: outer membrane lipoprotein-sorting protein [Deltaproteobacteria bacterium]|nr:outer membrane lipoprotein-sorting protein [Deltaproteobacteria bacterium]
MLDRFRLPIARSAHLAALVATTLAIAAPAPGQEGAVPVPTPAAASAPSPAASANEARVLLEAVDRLDDTTRHWNDRTQRMKLHIVDGRGIERNRELIMRTLKRPNGEDKTSTVFVVPPEVRGTAFLQFAHKDRDAEQWLFLPALGRIRQIAAQSKNESFMGTDFSYRDLELLTDVFEWTEDEASARLVRNESIDGREAVLIEIVPKKKDVGYQRILLLLERQDLLLRRMEFYGSGDTPKKRLQLDAVRDVQGIPTAFTLEMVQPPLNSKTDVTVVDVKYNQNLPEDLFTTRALERGALDAE